MGNRHHSHEQLQFYTNINFKNYGHCQVYTSNKFPQSFIIKVIYSLTYNDNYHHNLELYAKIQDMQNLYLIGMYGYRLGKNCNCPSLRSDGSRVQFLNDYVSNSDTSQGLIKIKDQCQNMVTSSFLTAYWDIISQRIKMRSNFKQSEIWHIIKACTQAYPAFHTNCISFEFKPSKILVNQDGRVRLDWMEIQPKNTHSTFHKKLYKKQSESKISMTLQLSEEQYLSPEQLVLLRQQQFTNKINHEKTNVFTLGMTILACMTLQEPTIAFYNLYSYSIMYDKIIQTINSLESYSYELIRLLEWMLAPQSTHRPDFETIKKQFNQFMKSDYCIQTTKEPIYQKKVGFKEDYREVSRKISITQIKKSQVFMNYGPVMKDGRQIRQETFGYQPSQPIRNRTWQYSQL